MSERHKGFFLACGMIVCFTLGCLLAPAWDEPFTQPALQQAAIFIAWLAFSMCSGFFAYYGIFPSGQRSIDKEQGP